MMVRLPSEMTRWSSLSASSLKPVSVAWIVKSVNSVGATRFAFGALVGAWRATICATVVDTADRLTWPASTSVPVLPAQRSIPHWPTTTPPPSPSPYRPGWVVPMGLAAATPPPSPTGASHRVGRRHGRAGRPGVVAADAAPAAPHRPRADHAARPACNRAPVAAQRRPNPRAQAGLLAIV